MTTSINLRHGVFMAPFHQMHESPTLTLQRDLELMELLDRLGFDEAWIGEHHSAGFETIDSPEIFIAAAAERTKRLRFGTGVISLPYHNPLMVANRIIQLDHMTMGRVMLGVGPGLLASDALMLGIEPEVTRDRMVEALDVILRLFRGEFVTEETDWYTLRDAHVHLLPFTKPHPEVCVASAVTPSGGRVAGTYDTGLLAVASNDRAAFDALATNWTYAEEIAAQHGRTMDRGRLRVVTPIHLADSKEQAMENVRYGMKADIDYLNNNMPRISIPDGVDPVAWALEADFAVIGTPDEAIARIERLIEKQGEFGCVLLSANNWAPWEATKYSYELYARYVMPHFADANRNRFASYAWVTRRQQDLVDKRNAAAKAEFDKYEAAHAQTT